MQTSDFDYELPPELIAQFPAPVRRESRLLRLAESAWTDHRFDELPELLRAGDLLVANDTKVIKARLLGHKLDSGGRVEALIERVLGTHEALAQMRASKPLRAGMQVVFADSAGTEGTSYSGNARHVQALVGAREGEFVRLTFPEPVLGVLEAIGQVPLPPYVTHSPEHLDNERYQTVYARAEGSVAAPTAGLHFDAPLFEALAKKGIERAFVTLHVGAGTFKPIRVDDPLQHVMHFERYSVSPESAAKVNAARQEGRRIIAVGTTSTRTLEAATDKDGRLQAGDGETNLYITPGYHFRMVDALITNFHLPRSTLLMLVSALAGHEVLLQAYRHAVAARYRFFSYGDAMLIEPGPRHA